MKISFFKAKTAFLNTVTRDNPPNLTNKDFTIEDWGRKITHQQEEGKGITGIIQKTIFLIYQLNLSNEREFMFRKKHAFSERLLINIY